jgi:hypothetical protein
VTKIQEAVAVEATIAQRAWAEELEVVMAEVAGCFPRRESRALLRHVTEAMLLGLERVNC